MNVFLTTTYNGVALIVALTTTYNGVALIVGLLVLAIGLQQDTHPLYVLPTHFITLLVWPFLFILLPPFPKQHCDGISAW